MKVVPQGCDSSVTECRVDIGLLYTECFLL